MDYVDKPSSVRISGTKENLPIVGLAVLGNSLFVSYEKTPEIEVYDSSTYVLQRQIKISQIKDPLDIASCVPLSCLFLIGRLESPDESTFSHILKTNSDGKELIKWKSKGNSGRLSTYESSVIVCLSDKSLVCEYDREGNLTHEVPLSPAAGFYNLSHAIKVTSMHFVVSHGEKNDKEHRVCLVDRGGNIIEKCEYWEKTKVPVCLLNDGGRSILVGDKEGRIILLNSNVKFQRKLIEKGDNCVASRISFDARQNYVASRISFDGTGKRLFVAKNKVSSKTKDLKEGQVLVFNVK